MEYVGLLNRIDSEDVGESWVEVLMQTFNFSEDPLLFHCLKSLNDNIRDLDTNNGGNNSCGCSLPPTRDVWWWTRYFSVNDTRAIVINSDTSVISNYPLDYEIQWAKSGVLFINNFVNPECRARSCHTAWETITNGCINFIANNNPAVVFLLCGSSARLYPSLQRSPSKVLELREEAHSGNSSRTLESDLEQEHSTGAAGCCEAEYESLNRLLMSRLMTQT